MTCLQREAAFALIKLVCAVCSHLRCFRRHVGTQLNERTPTLAPRLCSAVHPIQRQLLRGQMHEHLHCCCSWTD